MKTYIFYIILIHAIITACNNKETKKDIHNISPVISNNGLIISFPDNKEILSLFKTQTVTDEPLKSTFSAPGIISAITLPNDGVEKNIILFENPDIAGYYTQWLQNQINIHQIQNVIIKQKEIELNRIKDLHSHGAASGQELLEAQTALSIEQTNLANEKTASIEKETKLIFEGLPPKMLQNAKAGIAYLICNIPENQIKYLETGSNCNIFFTAYPNQSFIGKVDGIADIIDNSTRMVKVRIIINNSAGNLKAGMFANVTFNTNEKNYISIPKNSLITVQGKHYVFVKKSTNQFERRQIEINQQIGDKIIVLSGLEKGEEIAVEGVMQLKGLSFGY